MKVSELFENKKQSAETAERVFGNRATLKGKKILVKMDEKEYNSNLAKILFDLDDGRDWTGEYKDGTAIFTPYAD